MALALVRDLRDHRAPVSEEELADFETDVLARASAGLADSTIRNDTGHLELIRDWFGRPLWEMQPGDADAYFGTVLREARPSTRTGRAAALTVYFQFLELRHKIELHNLTGRVIECPLGMVILEVSLAILPVVCQYRSRYRRSPPCCSLGSTGLMGHAP